MGAAIDTGWGERECPQIRMTLTQLGWSTGAALTLLPLFPSRRKAPTALLPRSTCARVAVRVGRGAAEEPSLAPFRSSATISRFEEGNAGPVPQKKELLVLPFPLSSVPIPRFLKGPCRYGWVW